MHSPGEPAAGLRSRDRSDGVTELVRWILGGDLKFGAAYLQNEIKEYQRDGTNDEEIQLVDYGSTLMRHGDLPWPST
eukprot:8325115-Pyramimonas_sp.AAC.1